MAQKLHLVGILSTVFIFQIFSTYSSPGSSKKIEIIF